MAAISFADHPGAPPSTILQHESTALHQRARSCDLGLIAGCPDYCFSRAYSSDGLE